MKKLRNKLFSVIFLALISVNAHAGMPVIDIAAIAQMIEQGIVEGKQLATQADQLIQMEKQVENGLQQIQQLKQQYENLSGITKGIHSIGDIGSAARQVLSNLPNASSIGNSVDIQKSVEIMNIAQTGIDPNSATGKLFQQTQQQNAVNLAAIQTAYKSSFDRISGYVNLLNQIAASPSAKNIEDLQARIQSEHVFLQNESNQVALMAQLQNAQKSIREQQEKEIRLKAHENRTGLKF